MRRSPRRRQQSGYALMFVFLMAAVIAISLYMEIPRVAFESQRQKEQILVERGEQYKRAIRMFFAANKRYPATIEEMESFNNRRYLRKRFRDPMTGKEEWRFIHIQAGILMDSLVQKPKGPQQAGSSQSQLVGEMPASALDPSAAGTSAPNMAMRRRASDGTTPGMGGPGAALDPNNPNNAYNPGNPVNPGDPNNPNNQNPNQNQPIPGIPGSPLMPGQVAQAGQPYPGMPGQPGQTVQPGQFGQPYPGVMGPTGMTSPTGNGSSAFPPGYIPPQGVPMPGQPTPYPYPGAVPPNGYQGQPVQYPGQPAQYPGQPAQYPGQPAQYPGQAVQYPGQAVQYPGQAVQYPGQPVQYPGQPVQYPGQPVNSQTGGVSAYPYPTTPGANGTPPPIGQPGSNIPQGANPATQMIQQILTSPRPGGAPTANAAPGMIGGGIAGVASNADAEGIMVIGDRTNYKEWEFIFDPTKVKPIPNPLTGAIGQSATQFGSGSGNTPTPPTGPAPPVDPSMGGQTTYRPPGRQQ